MSRIDQFFSPERLRNRWDEEPPPPPPVVEEPAPLKLYARLQALAKERFAPEAAVSLLVAQVGTLLARRYAPAGGGDGGDGGDPAELAQAIAADLSRIEDLADAAWLGRRRR